MAELLRLGFKLLSFVGEDKRRYMNVVFNPSRGISVSRQERKQTKPTKTNKQTPPHTKETKTTTKPPPKPICI